MKKILSILAIALMGAFVFSSCEEEVVTEPLATIIVSGQVTANLDLTATDEAAVPNGTTIIFRIDSQDLVQKPISGYTYNTLQYEAKVVDGKYSIELPAVDFNAATVDIVPVDFKHDQIRNAEGLKKEGVVFSSPSYPITIRKGEVYYEDISYYGI